MNIRYSVLGTQYSVLFVLLAFLIVPARPSSAQQTSVPRIDEAELVFQQAIEAFEQGDYGMAYRRFRLVYDTYPIHRKTTAALLMAGKALYRDGDFQRAVDLLDTLIRLYPTSGYLEEARRVREFALGRVQDGGVRQTVRNLGIVLPTGGSDASLTQALFTGIRIAVEESNQANPNSLIRMVFRNSGADPQQAARAVNELAQSGVEAIIGPLYSNEAIEAARAAERAGIVMIAPMANDETVSDGRRHVFQANPTITTHGRQMARFAIKTLNLDEFGIIAERDRDQISERMAEGFQEEASVQGAEVEFYKVLRSSGDWGRLDGTVGADSIRRVQAVYMPVSGGETVSRIDAALSSFDRMNVGGSVRILGNTEWHDLAAGSRAARYQTTYTSDFYVNEGEPAVRAFRDKFQEMIGRSADPGSTTGRLAFTGYDVTRFLLGQLTRSSSRPLRERLRDAPASQGLGLRIDFRNGNVNEALYFFRYQDGAVRLLR